MRAFLAAISLAVLAFAPLAFAAERAAAILYDVNGQTNVSLITWTGLLNGDTGQSVENADYADRTMQVSGTFGTGGSVRLEGSNDGTNWIVLSDFVGDAATFTVAGMAVILENPRYLRVNVTAGDGNTDLTVTLFSKRIR